MSRYYDLYVSIGFVDGQFVFGKDGEHPATASLSADLTHGRDDWTIASVYLASQWDGEPRQELSGPAAEQAKRMLLDSDDFNDWANEQCRHAAYNEEAGERFVASLNALHAHLGRINEAA